MTTALREAVATDCAAVYAWNFAPDVRAQSRTATQVAPREHERWFASRLARVADGAPMWIIEDDAAPVGVLRLDPIDDAARISIAIAADARGRGIGRRAITAACARFARPVVAEVLARNTASRVCFEACGFRPIARRDDVVTYRWSPTP